MKDEIVAMQAMRFDWRQLAWLGSTVLAMAAVFAPTQVRAEDDFLDPEVACELVDPPRLRGVCRVRETHQRTDTRSSVRFAWEFANGLRPYPILVAHNRLSPGSPGPMSIHPAFVFAEHGLHVRQEVEAFHLLD